MSYLIEPFSLEWILTNFLSFTLIIFLLLSPRYILKNDLALNRKTLSYFFLVFLICRMLVFHLVALTLGVWDVEHILPFHLCGIASLMCIFILFKYNQSIYEFLLLLGMPGAVWALLTPQINIHEPFYMYIDYFINHAMIIFVPIYLTFYHGKKPRKKSYLKIFITMNLLVIPLVLVINIFLKKFLSVESVNYMYLMSPPQADNPLIINGWSYMIGLELVALIHMFLVYSFFTFIYNRNYNFKL